MDILKQLYVNIPLVEVLEQIPNYVKFLEDILAKEKKLGEYEIVMLTKECNNDKQDTIKHEDLRSFTIPISIGGQNVGQATCDIGASINLMPLLIYKKLGMGETQLSVMLQLQIDP